MNEGADLGAPEIPFMFCAGDIAGADLCIHLLKACIKRVQLGTGNKGITGAVQEEERRQ